MRGWGILHRRQAWSNLQVSACSLQSPRLVVPSARLCLFLVSAVTRAQAFWSWSNPLRRRQDWPLPVELDTITVAAVRVGQSSPHELLTPAYACHPLLLSCYNQTWGQIHASVFELYIYIYTNTNTLHEPNTNTNTNTALYVCISNTNTNTHCCI